MPRKETYPSWSYSAISHLNICQGIPPGTCRSVELSMPGTQPPSFIPLTTRICSEIFTEIIWQASLSNFIP